jgi:endonuclease/exonuclease/phosphatase family metal-dependent hydrolase
MGSEDPLGFITLAAIMSFTRFLLLLTLAIATPLSAADSFRVLSQNLNRLFDDIDDGNNEKVLSHAKFRERVKTTAEKIGYQFDLPEIIALQEVENENLLDAISLEISHHHGLRYQTVLIPGQDISGINIGYLVHPSLSINEVAQLFRDTRQGYNHHPLFSRPPLYIEVCRHQQCLSVVNLHLRSMRGIDSQTDGQRVRTKRLQQASTIAAWIDDFQAGNPGSSLMLIGDFNALTPSDRQVDVVGIIRGDPDNEQTRIRAEDLLEPDLVDLTLQVSKSRRYSYIYRKKKQQLDYMMVNQGFQPSLVKIGFSRIDYHFSDHAGLIAEFNW